MKRHDCASTGEKEEKANGYESRTHNDLFGVLPARICSVLRLPDFSDSRRAQGHALDHAGAAFKIGVNLRHILLGQVLKELEALLRMLGGRRNAEASRQKLKELGIPLLAEDTGLNYGRTVELHCDTGEFYIKSVGKELKII